MYLLYDALLLPFAPVASAAVRLPVFRRHAERLGRYEVDWRARLGDRRVLWLHAASVGELLAARRLAAALRTAFPDAALVASTTSFAGRDLAVRMPEMDGALLLPLDFPAAIDRAIDALRPTAFVFTETEIWPNLLRAF